MTATLPPAVSAPPLPEPRGPRSAALIEALRTAGPLASFDAPDPDPFGEDLALSLYLCYELHYRGFADATADREWDPAVLAFRRDLERVFLAALRTRVQPPTDDAGADMARLLEELRSPPSHRGITAALLARPQRDRLREVLVQRSMYHLKEADPQAWALPRLEGAAKALVAAVEFDEYGGGDPERMHSELYAALMQGFDLSREYNAYLDAVAAPMLAVVNFMSMCGLHRALRGALVGQLTVVELTSPLSSQRMIEVVRRCDGGPEAQRFYAEHAVADAVHERVMREAIDDLTRRTPGLIPDVVFGMRAAMLLDERFDAHVLDSWEANRSSLRRCPWGRTP